MKSQGARVGILLLVALGIGLSWFYRSQFAPEAVESGLARLGIWGPVVFVGIYTLAPALFLPGSVLTLAGGAMFGTVPGALLSLIGATMGATIAFLIARYVASDWVERRASGRLRAIKTGVEEQGWRFVAFTRLVPIFPFNLLNYAFGLTRCSLATFSVTSFITMAPGALVYAYAGNVGLEAVRGGSTPVFQIGLAVALLAALALLPTLIGRWRRPSTLSPLALQELLAGETPPVVLDVRSPDEFVGELGHIEGATLVPLSELNDRLDEVAPVHDRTLVAV